MNKPPRYGLFLALYISIILVIIFGLYELIVTKYNIFYLTKIILFFICVAACAIIIAILVINIVPYFKNFLLEKRSFKRFESLSHPLLLRLSLEAPGTYHHSLMVANLAYRAAQEIKADAILARIGAYYHDVGKLSDPEIFIENQTNISKKTYNSLQDIQQAASKIIKHSSYGVQLAQKYELPSQIIAFIAEHHGTTTTFFFLTKAQTISAKTSKKPFTYPGPKPLSAETAIVMLADAIEAKIRLFHEINKEKITKVVDEIISDRLHEKQLQLSGLTRDQITKIRNSFIKTLSTIHHQRINYPTIK